MFLVERHDAILDILARDGKVRVKDLSDRFHVTEDCIRKDLGALEKQGLLPEEREAVDVFVVALGEEARIPAFRLLHELRAAKFSASMDFAGRSMKAQMKQANKKNARFVAILGEDEVKEASALLKDMKTSEQKKLALKDFVPALCVEVKN